MRHVNAAPAAREYLSAFYRGNHASFVAAIALTLLDVPAALVGSWIIGEIIDAITSADPGRLTQLLAF